MKRKKTLLFNGWVISEYDLQVIYVIFIIYINVNYWCADFMFVALEEQMDV